MLSCGWGFNLKGKVLLRVQGCIVLPLATLPSSWVGWSACTAIPIVRLSFSQMSASLGFVKVCVPLCTVHVSQAYRELPNH